MATVSTHPLLFSSSSGHVGALPRHWVHTEGEGEEGERVKEKNNNVVQQDNEPISETDDQLFDDSLLLEVMYIHTVLCVLMYSWFGQEIGLVIFLIFYFRLHVHAHGWCYVLLSLSLLLLLGRSPPSSKCVCLSVRLSVYVGLTIFKVNKLLTLIAGFAPSMFYILLVIIIIIIIITNRVYLLIVYSMMKRMLRNLLTVNQLLLLLLFLLLSARERPIRMMETVSTMTTMWLHPLNDVT